MYRCIHSQRSSISAAFVEAASWATAACPTVSRQRSQRLEDSVSTPLPNQRPTALIPEPSTLLPSSSTHKNPHIHLHRPIPPICPLNLSYSAFPVLSKYRIFLKSSTPLCCSNSSRAYCAISSRVGEGGIWWQARRMVR